MAIESAPPGCFTLLLSSLLFDYNYDFQDCTCSEKQQLPIIYVIFQKIAITLAPYSVCQKFIPLADF